MNIETKSGGIAGPDFTNPEVLADHVASVVSTLIQVTDPRLIINALLNNAAGLSQLVLSAGKATPAHVAHAFSSSMVEALTAPKREQEEPRIEVVPAGVIDLKTRR